MRLRLTRVLVTLAGLALTLAAGGASLRGF